MKTYVIDFGSVIIEAKDEQDAYAKAISIIRAGDVEIDQITED